MIKSTLEERSLRLLHAVVDKPSVRQRKSWLDHRASALSLGKPVEAVVVEVRKDPPGVIIDTGDPPPDLKLPAPAPKAAKPATTDDDDFDPEQEAPTATTTKHATKSAKGGDEETEPEPRPQLQPPAPPPVVHRAFLPLPAEKDRYNPKALPVEKRFAVGDLMWVRREPSLGETKEKLPIVAPEFGPQAAVIVIDPSTREVRAMVGGYGFHPGGLNRALRSARQPGSAFKPFLYALAMKDGQFTPATIMNDSPTVIERNGMPPWIPKNAESHEFRGPVRLRVALAKSLNTVAAQLVYMLGAEPLARLANDMGIETKLSDSTPAPGEGMEAVEHFGLAIGIGAAVVKLDELTNAYATFATGGKRAPSIIISKIGEAEQPRPSPTQVITPELSYLVTSLMESVIDEGTAASAKSKIRRPAAGKTGTTNRDHDAWFVGFTPDIVVGVWVGFDDMRDLGRGEQGARSALPIWVDVINGALKGVPARSFTQPPGIVIARIDPASGMLAPPGSAHAIDEKFLQGTAPTQVAPEQGTPNPDTFVIDQPQQ